LDVKKFSLPLLLSLLAASASNSFARQTTPPQAPPAPRESEAATPAPQREALLQDLRALDAEAKELTNPIDAASAKAEIADAAWTLDREWAKKLLRAATELTFPAEVDRRKVRERPVGSRLQPPTPEDSARGMVRRRVLKVAGRDRAFAEELSELVSRELGGAAEVMHFAVLADAAVAEGQLEDAGGYILRAIEADPTLITAYGPINALANRDRAAADRLIVEYVARLRALPLSAYAEHGGASSRIPFGFMMMLVTDYAPAGGAGARTPPGREAVRAYITYVLDTLERLEQAQPGGSRGARMMLTTAWPLLLEHAPDLSARFHALESLSRNPGAREPPLMSREQLESRYERTVENRLNVARQTKDPLDVEMAVSTLMSKGDFAEARKMLELLRGDDLRAKLSEEVNTRECMSLTEKGDAVGAERLARQLTRPQSVLRAFPPLVRRLVKNNDASSASILTNLAVRLLREAEERGRSNDTYVPTLLAPVAGSINPFRQSRSLVALSELAAAIRPLSAETALEILEEVVRSANQNRIGSENGNPNFNTDVFMMLAATDGPRVRHAAEALRDRLQRIAALAALHRGRAESLARSPRNQQVSTHEPLP
jgi:tetratricopeptide (TPR) repeat protein